MQNNTQAWTMYRRFQLFHTTVRNSIILTTLSFALLSVSRYYREKQNRLYNTSFIILSLAFLACSMIVNIFLLLDQNNIKKIMGVYNIKHDLSINIIEKWYIIPLFLIFANFIMLGFGLCTLFKFI